jgi:hypothetical protein
LEIKRKRFYGAAAILALAAAAMLIVAFLVTDAVVSEEVRSTSGWTNP